MTNAQRIYDLTCRHLQTVQTNIDRLAELNANEELALLTSQLQRLSFRAAPAAAGGVGSNGGGARTNFTFIT